MGRGCHLDSSTPSSIIVTKLIITISRMKICTLIIIIVIIIITVAKIAREPLQPVPQCFRPKKAERKACLGFRALG